MLLVEEVPSFNSWREFELFETNHSDVVHTMLSNFDGAFWEIYSRDHNLLKRLISKHRSDENLDLYNVDYELDTKAIPIRHFSQLENYKISRSV